jgi:hypothetical protein
MQREGEIIACVLNESRAGRRVASHTAASAYRHKFGARSQHVDTRFALHHLADHARATETVGVKQREDLVD